MRKLKLFFFFFKLLQIHFMKAQTLKNTKRWIKIFAKAMHTIKIDYTVIFKKVSTAVFLNFTIVHVYISYLQVELFIAIIFYYIKKHLVID